MEIDGGAELDVELQWRPWRRRADSAGERLVQARGGPKEVEGEVKRVGVR